MRIAYLCCFFTGSALVYSWVRKLADFSERKWYGVLFYTIAIYKVAPKLIKAGNFFTNIAHTIDLSRSGHQIILNHYRYGLFPLKTYCNIEHVARFEGTPTAAGLRVLGYSEMIQLNGEIFHLPIDRQARNAEVLKAIL